MKSRTKALETLQALSELGYIEDIISILDKIRILGANTQKKGSDHE